MLFSYSNNTFRFPYTVRTRNFATRFRFGRGFLYLALDMRILPPKILIDPSNGCVVTFVEISPEGIPYLLLGVHYYIFLERRMRSANRLLTPIGTAI